MRDLPFPVVTALQALSCAVGEGVELDDRGECALLFADEVEVVIAYAPETELLSARTPLAGGPTPPDLLHAALALNYGGLALHERLALDAQTDALVLWTGCDARAVMPDEFLERVAGLVEMAPQVRARLASADFHSDAWPHGPCLAAGARA